MTKQASYVAADCPEDATALLREFLASDEALCPVCRASVQGVSDATCPRCGTLLALALHPSPPRFGWFLVMLAPLIVTWGLAFVLLLAAAVSGPISPAPGPCALALVAAIDIPAAVALWEQRDALLAAPQAQQRKRAAVAWGIHIGLAAMTLGALAL